MTTSSKTSISDVYDDFLDYSGNTDRPGQRAAVDMLIELSESPDVEAYAIQAPTGTGKSYAALLAGVHNASKSRRTVIGTSTVVLSDQYQKDILAVSKHFPDVKFCVLKGATNYYCGNKVAEALHKTKDPVKKRDKMNELLLFRKGITDRLPLWAQADTENCSDCTSKLKKRGSTECEYARARAVALTADVVVTTHAMINVDVKLKAMLAGTIKSEDGSSPSAILGKVWLTVFDEAHKASEALIYSEQFGVSQLNVLIYHGALNSMEKTKRDAFQDHFARVNETAWYHPSPTLAKELLELWPTPFDISTGRTRTKNLDDDNRKKVARNLYFLKKARDILDEIALGHADGGEALWTETMRHGDGSTTCIYKIKEMTPEPVMVKAMTSMRTAWMSATIGTETHPTYSLKKCGLVGGVFKALPTPFDYSRQLQWTVRTDNDVPNQGAFVSSINKHWPGGCAVLTPYHKRKEKIATALREADPSCIVLQQSTVNSSTANAAAVAAHISAAEAGGSPVLVGVEIFSTGIDLPGDQLTKLIVADLFPIRDSYPFIAWKGRWIESVGGKAFDDYVLPERAITLEQQIGRIVRRETDAGVCIFYVSNKDWRSGSQGERIIHEALRRFPGARRI